MRAVICKGDRTSHGGRVLEGNPNVTTGGRQIAQLGHSTICPLCKGKFPIVEGVATHTYGGKPTAVHGMKTACGATLIASQQEMLIDAGGGEPALPVAQEKVAQGSIGTPAKDDVPFSMAYGQATYDPDQLRNADLSSDMAFLDAPIGKNGKPITASLGPFRVKGIQHYSKVNGLPETVTTIDKMPSRGGYQIVANYEIRDGQQFSNVPAFYTAYNKNAGRIDYVIGQTDLSGFMRDVAGYYVMANADHAPKYVKDSNSFSASLAQGDFSQAGQHYLSAWEDALRSPEWWLSTTTSVIGGVIGKEASVAAIERQTYSDALTGLPINGATRTVPHGFADNRQFLSAARDLLAALEESGVSDATVGVRGSSVTGFSAQKGTLFGPQSDIDFFVESGQLTNGYTTSKNIPGFVHPQKILPDFPSLQTWAERWSKILGREVTPGAFKPGSIPKDPSIVIIKK
jgi:uncharacterized Zn-binding protein involved in type VI secretion